jgi:CCR4-NOT transcription complex subunit 7/8
MPQAPSRFQSGPPSISPYQHQFSSHPSQSHATGHQPPSLGSQGYLASSQMGPFGATNGLGLGNGMNAGGGFGLPSMGGAGDQTGLGSHAARMGFAHGAQMQQQQQHPHQQSHGLGAEHSTRQGGASKGRIRDVWKHNLTEEMAVLRELVDDYPYVAMVR